MPQVLAGRAAECHAIGYLVEQNDEKVVVLPHFSPGKGDDEAVGDGEITLLRSWVDQIIILEEQPQRRRRK